MSPIRSSLVFRTFSTDSAQAKGNELIRKLRALGDELKTGTLHGMCSQICFKASEL